MFKVVVLAFLYTSEGILLVHRTGTGFGNGLYGMVGGKVEDGETALQAMHREILEETALDIPESSFELVHTLHCNGSETEFIALCFKADISTMAQPHNCEPHKHDDMRFFAIDQLPDNILPVHLQIIRCIENKISYSQHGWERRIDRNSPQQRRMVQASSTKEWTAIRSFRHRYFFGPNGIQDPYEYTFAHHDHRHFVLYQGNELVGYAHVQFWPEHRAIVRIMVIEEQHRNQGLGQALMQLLEEWLVAHGHKVVCIDSRPTAVRFYESCGYQRAPFADPEGHEQAPQDVQMQKVLGEIIDNKLING